MYQYDGTSKRPSEFNVQYTIDGGKPIPKTFLNTPTGDN